MTVVTAMFHSLNSALKVCRMLTCISALSALGSYNSLREILVMDVTSLLLVVFLQITLLFHTLRVAGVSKYSDLFIATIFMFWRSEH